MASFWPRARSRRREAAPRAGRRVQRVPHAEHASLVRLLGHGLGLAPQRREAVAERPRALAQPAARVRRRRPDLDVDLLFQVARGPHEVVQLPHGPGPVGGVGRREQRAEPRLGVGQHRLQLGLVLLEHGCTLTRRVFASRFNERASYKNAPGSLSSGKRH